MLAKLTIICKCSLVVLLYYTMSTIKYLTEYFKPTHYDLDLTIDKKNRYFGGTVTMAGNAKADEVHLHAKDLTIKSVRTNLSDQPTWRTDGDQLIIKGRLKTVTVEYEGKFSETAMNGLYLCKYKRDGVDKELFATQFESSYAREAFPCIDEPAAKATFDIKITTNDPDDKVVLSNMPGHREGNTWIFDTTPKMSTYLVAFVGGDLISQSTTTKNGVKINAYATSAQQPEALDYAVEVAKSSVEFYEDYFGVKYPLPKLDNVALPDFSAGAMENWGLITYRETALLNYPSAAKSDRETIATVIAHEIAHQWFGDLVTMKWWNDLWLNESFASVMENFTVDKLYPEYHVWDSFNYGDVHAALSRDSLSGVQSVRQDVTSPEEIATLFDGAIVYAKGERLLKMAKAYTGEEAFRAGLNSYFKAHAYGNTTADDLWYELGKASGKDVKGLIDPWLNRPGYPVVTIERQDDKVTLTQHEFHTDGSADSGRTWPIPLFSNRHELPEVLDERSITVKIPSSGKIELNVGNNAHFITQYDKVSLDQLQRDLGHATAIDQVKLIEESLLLSRAGLTTISPLVHLLVNVHSSDNRITVQKISSALGSLASLTDINSAEETHLKQYTRNLFGDEFHQLFLSGKKLTLDEERMQGCVLSNSTWGENPEALKYCDDMYNQHRSDLAQISGDIRVSVLSSIVKRGDDTVFDELWQKYLAETNPDLRLDIGSALTSTKNVEKAKFILAQVLEAKNIKPQDSLYFVAWLLYRKQPDIHSLAWQWIRDNWNWIEEVFGGDMSYTDYIRIAGSGLHTDAELVEFDQFFNSKAEAVCSLKRAVTTSHNSIVGRLQWIKTNKPVLQKLLSEE